MIAILSTATLLMLSASLADAAATKSLLGVDPNTLSCDPTGHTFLLLPHFTDCNKYYVCSHGVEVERTCNGLLIFDFVTQGCNWDWATKCWLREIEEEVEGSGSGEGEELEWAWKPAAAHAAPVTHEAVETKSSGMLDCTKVETAAKLVAYKTDCQRYWRCASGVPQTFYCTDGLFFNEAKQQCDFEANVKCEQKEELGEEFMVYN